MTRKDVKGVIESLAKIGYMELKKSGAFLVPGFAKFVVINKPATKERSGINPFTKEPTIFKAKPARKIVRARPIKLSKTLYRSVGNIIGSQADFFETSPLTEIGDALNF
jgi:DNA-binding protein HU-beta